MTATLITIVAAVLGMRALIRLWQRDRLAGSFVTGLLAALAITAGLPALIGVPLAFTAWAICWRETLLLDRTDDRFAIGAHRWPLEDRSR